MTHKLTKTCLNDFTTQMWKPVKPLLYIISDEEQGTTKQQTVAYRTVVKTPEYTCLVTGWWTWHSGIGTCFSLHDRIMVCQFYTLASNDVLVQWRKECIVGVQSRRARKCRVIASTVQKWSAGVQSIAEQFGASVQSDWAHRRQFCYAEEKNLCDSVSFEVLWIKPSPHNKKKKSATRECNLKLSLSYKGISQLNGYE